MPSVNKVILIGNLTRDPEIRYTPKGSAVTELGMAMNRQYKLENGETREEVCYVDVTFWGRQAETLGKWMKKGRAIYVEGRLQLDSWDDKTSGKKVYKLRVVGENFQFLGEGRGGGDDHEGDGGGAPTSHQGGGSGQRSAPTASSGPPAAGGDFPPGLDEDDIPF